jgi:undecaprenyl-diphosphatase
VLLATAATVPQHLTWFQATVVGLLQGVTELFPLSSLGHSVLLPAILGWHNVVSSESASESFYLAFIVGLHVATALALLVYFWRDWVRIITAGIGSIGRRKVETPDERLFWLLVVVTIPAGVLGLTLEHVLRTQFAKPTAAGVFLFINGLILLGGEWLRRQELVRAHAPVASGVGPAPGPGPDSDEGDPGPEPDTKNLASLGYPDAFVIGLFQSLALIAGISRSGVTMVGGLVRGLNHEDAARFSFLAATPVILAAGLLKVPDLTGPLGKGLHGQILLGSAVAAVAAYVSVRFLMKYFETRTLTPFAIYCLLAGGICAIGFGTGLF